MFRIFMLLSGHSVHGHDFIALTSMWWGLDFQLLWVIRHAQHGKSLGHLFWMMTVTAFKERNTLGFIPEDYCNKLQTGWQKTTEAYLKFKINLLADFIPPRGVGPMPLSSFQYCQFNLSFYLYTTFHHLCLCPDFPFNKDGINVNHTMHLNLMINS